MAIIKIKTGKSNTEDSRESGKYTFFDRSQTIKKSDKFLYDGEYIIIPGEGVFKPKYYKGKFDLHQRAYCITSLDKMLLNKYLFFFIYKNKNKFYDFSVGSTVPSLRLSSFKWIELSSFPKLEVQQKIIDIIEPIEKLFIKYSNTIRIDTYENCETDIKNLIDIIEPIEKLIKNVSTQIEISENILKKMSNNMTNTNTMLKNVVTFQKGKSLKSDEFNIEGTPFIDIRMINSGKISKYVNFEKNTQFGDILLSLDGTTGLVKYNIEGFNGYAYNVKSNSLKKYEIYLNLINTTNQMIIENNSRGTTIKHASLAKEKMYFFKLDNKYCSLAENIFENLLKLDYCLKQINKIKNKQINLLIK